MRVFRNLLLTAALLSSTGAAALPIGFGVNQRDREYYELKSDNFLIYHDKRVPTEGAMTLNALEAARPFIEQWFKIKRSSRLPVITSAATENASFANFITDALEIQTSGQGTKELAWHEYTHSSMYRHFDTILGPAASIIFLPFMPPWFLEGLAETTSVSVSSDVTAGVERYQALTGDWPTYDRLHSLYAKYGFFERGYATAGAIVTYVLKKGDANRLPGLLEDFRAAAAPWWWLYTALPVVGKLPMDEALENFIGIGGEDLFDRYKKDAAAFWTSYSTDPLLIQRDGARRNFATVYGMRSDGKDIRQLARVDDELQETTVAFDAATGFATDLKKVMPALDDGFESYARIYNPGLRAAVKFEKVKDEDWSRLKIVKGGGKSAQTGLHFRPGSIFQLWETPGAVAFLEQHMATTRLCAAQKPGDEGGIRCPISATVPKKLRSLGARMTVPGGGIAKEIWLVDSEEKLKGTLYTVTIVDASTLKVVRTLPATEARPISVAFAGEDTYLLYAERNRRTLRRVDDAGACAGMITVKDHVLDAFGLDDGSLVLALYHGDTNDLIKLAKGELKEHGCSLLEGPTSPLQAAIRLGPRTELSAALSTADLWVRPDGSHGEIKRFKARAEKDGGSEKDRAPKGKGDPTTTASLATEPAIDKDSPKGVNASTESKPKRWRGRPLFAVPWIGGDDALGTQVGAVSVPLMDHLQNETLRATVLYGVNSRFPNTDLTFTETRFRPTILVTGYRQQTYNGNFVVGDHIETGYMDEKGLRTGADWDFEALGGTLGLGIGLKVAHLKPYLGPYRGVRKGLLTEPTLSLALGEKLGEFNWANSVFARVAPKALNKNFDYNQLGFASALSRAFPLDSRLTLGVDYSRTRGEKTRELKEYYQPLKTFIPGSGGGYNQNNFALVETAGGLFSATQSNNQGRAKATWTVPVIPDIDKTLWILYMERLDFTAFYNYGAAWTYAVPRNGWAKLIRAHGYNLDLQLERYGVRVNTGAGIGQVIGKAFEAYLKFGFDALL